MIKYLYLLGILFSFVTFMIGWNNFTQNQTTSIFNVGLILLTPMTIFPLTLLWLKQKDKEECSKKSQTDM